MKPVLAIIAALCIMQPHNFRAQQKFIQVPVLEKMTAKNTYGAFLNNQAQLNPGHNKINVTNNQIYCPDVLTIYSSHGTARYTASYNEKGLTTQRILQYYSNGQWINYTRDSWTYLNENNNSLDLGQIWVDNKWTNSSLDSSTYDSKGQMLVHLYKYWSQGEWKDSLLSFRTYDENENMLTNWGERWSGTKWVILPDSFSYAYTYNPNGQILTELYQIINNGHVENATLSTYTYNANGNMLSYLLQISANGIMTNSLLHEYTYDVNGRMRTDWLKGWTNGAWMNGSLYTYTYDANGNMTNILLQYWLNGQWTNSYQTTYTYDSNGNIVVGNNEGWLNSSWVQKDNTFEIRFYDGSSFSFTGYKITISYTSINITDVANNKDNVLTDYSLSQNYPNPFNPSTAISYQLPVTSKVSLKIFNSLGQEVATLIDKEMTAGNYTQQWDAAGMPSGVYFYQLLAESSQNPSDFGQAGSFIQTRKMVFMK